MSDVSMINGHIDGDKVTISRERYGELLKAEEKQIPKKPLEENKFYGNGKCPSCNAVFLDKSTLYCGNCGQALDWGETE